ncbi:uncharacterized protein [Magallana gigas]|uniref:uncharacterized protein n=1 Tax=Magallana gigas TaxID=29159 RepID=UPI00333E7BA2
MLTRISVGKRIEALQLRDIAKAVMEMTGEPMDELLELAGKDIRDYDAAKLLLHYCVLAANERGQPKGHVLQDDEAGPSTSGAPAERQNQTEDNTVENEATPVKRRKTIDDMERRLLMLEKLEKEDVSKEDNGASVLINDNQVTAEFDKTVEFNPMRIVPRQKGEWVTIRGQLGRNVSVWEYVLERSGVNEDTILRVRKWLTEGVDVTEFFTRFKGNFRGKSFDSELPPSTVFPNSALCKKYHAFICDVLYEKIRSGAIRVLGKVAGDFGDVPRRVGCNAFLRKTDEKSGYDHVRLSNDSQGYHM